MQDLVKHLSSNKALLTGEWLKKNSNYEKDICTILGMKEDTKRYWDAIWKQYYIEFKKGRSIWVDMVRYSEIFLKLNNEATVQTLNLFFIPNRKDDKASNNTYIDEIIVAKTSDLIDLFGIDEEMAQYEIRRMKDSPHSRNSQESLTPKTIKEIAIAII